MAIKDVQDRLRRAAAALDGGGVDYAVIGGNAVAEWVGRIDKAAVRFTQDVDLLIRREDLQAATDAMADAGFVYRHAGGVDFFLDGPDAKFRDAVHLIFAGEKVRDEYLLPAADVDESEASASFRVIALEAVIRMKLTSFRLKDRVHLLDMIGVGLIDESWPAQFIAALGARLQELLDNPDS